MTRTLRPAGTHVPVPVSGAAELTLARLEERRQELAAHSPSGMTLAAAALAVMAKTANGHTPDIRCDQQVRFRLMQLSGERALPFEDLAAIAVENEVGRETALAGLRVIAEALGYSLQPVGGESVDERTAITSIVAQLGRVTTDAAEALADGRIDEAEAARLDPQMDEVKARVHLWEAARAARKGAR